MTAEEILSQPTDVFLENFDGPDAVLNAVQLIQHVAPKLNAATDRLNKAIRGAEELLEQTNIGVPGHVQIYEWEAETDADQVEPEAEDAKDGVMIYEKWSQLAYKRWHARYRIVLQQFERGYDEDKGEVEYCSFETPLTDCPRDMKIDASPWIGHLLGNIAKTANDWTRRLDEDAEGIESTIKALEAAKRIKMAE